MKIVGISLQNIAIRPVGAFATAVSQLGVYWMLINQPPPR
jgi:hypothetical protein